jgi:broad specificity phosphatase PhoE
MTRVALVRHAHPSGTFVDHVDAPLDELGRQQARAVADELGARPPGVVMTSPLRRARETAAPLAARWGTVPVVTAAIGEIPSPPGPLGARGPWLRTVLAVSWRDLEAELVDWRSRLLDAVLALREDAVAFTHYVAINTVVGAADGDDRVTVFAPAHASVTELEVVAGRIVVVSRGRETAAGPASPDVR